MIFTESNAIEQMILDAVAWWDGAEASPSALTMIGKVACVHRKEMIAPAELEKSSEKSSEKILGLLKANQKLAARELADLMGITQRAVEKQIAILRKQERLCRIGPAKGGHWEVTE